MTDPGNLGIGWTQSFDVDISVELNSIFEDTVSLTVNPGCTVATINEINLGEYFIGSGRKPQKITFNRAPGCFAKVDELMPTTNNTTGPS